MTGGGGNPEKRRRITLTFPLHINGVRGGWQVGNEEKTLSEPIQNPSEINRLSCHDPKSIGYIYPITPTQSLPEACLIYHK